MAALIAGERNPMRLADLGRGRLRAGTDRLVEALTGRFTEHHAFLPTQMLARVDGITADIATGQARIDAQIGGLGPAVDPGRLAARALVVGSAAGAERPPVQRVGVTPTLSRSQPCL